MYDELIRFMQLYFSDEAVREMARSLDHLITFQKPFYDTPYKDIIALHQLEHNDSLMIQWRNQVHNDMDAILDYHHIRLIEDATLTEKNEIISALLLIMNLDDYTPLAITLESMRSDVEIFADIIAEYTTLDNTRVFAIVESLGPDLLPSMKMLAEAREKDIAIEACPEILQDLKLFTTAIAPINIAVHLVKDGMLVNQEFSDYLNFLKQDIAKGTDQEVATNIASLLLISSDGRKEPLIMFRNHSTEILGDLTKVKAIEVLLAGLYTNLNNLKKVEHEKSRLS